MSELRKRSAWLVVVGMLVLPVSGYAQDATLNGTVTDSTGGVLPGVTITATNEETGNTFVAITDGTGEFRLPVRIGVYRLTAELQGFTTVTRCAADPATPVSFPLTNATGFARPGRLG